MVGLGGCRLGFCSSDPGICNHGACEGKVNQQARHATYRAYRILIRGIFILLAVFFLAGDRVIWINCLTGSPGALWLLAYCLPAWFTAFD